MSHAGDAFRAEAKELLDAMVAIEDKAAEAWNDDVNIAPGCVALRHGITCHNHV